MLVILVWYRSNPDHQKTKKDLLFLHHLMRHRAQNHDVVSTTPIIPAEAPDQG